MKLVIQKIEMIPKLLLGMTLIVTISCSKDETPFMQPTETGEEARGENEDNLEALNSLIANLTYDADVLLNVQDTDGAASERTLTTENNEITGPNLGEIQECRTEDYSLESNFDDVAILRPTNGVVFPGALVIGNQGMLDGAPDPLTLDRAPVTLRLDLPGIGNQGTIVVNDPINSSVQSGVDNALEWWNANAYQEGYVNASNSSYQAATSYSSRQFSLDVGLNLDWATGSLASQFEYESTATRRFASVVFKQVFYTITMDTPTSPASVFAPSVTRSQAEAAFNSDAPPAYVSSVSYGRIIMVRMETTNTDTAVDLGAVLEYAGGVSAVATVNSTYDSILKTSSISVVTIGGNAEAASEAISLADIESGYGSLNSVITGENAVYSRNNPGVPIAYTIRYLKDNAIAKMGYSTDYRVVNCQTFDYDHESIDVDNNSIFDVRFRFIHKTPGTNNTTISNYYEVNVGQRRVLSPPDGAHDVEVEFQFEDLFVWRALGSDISYGYIASEKCFEVTSFLLEIRLASVSCN